MQESMKEVTSEVVPRRPVLGRRVTCQYYSPALVLSQNDEKRLQVVLELLQTEERYLSCLRDLKSVFEDKLYSSFIIAIKDIETIFPVELKEMRDFHECLYNTLKQRVLQWTERSTVGDLFVDFVSDNNQFDLLGLYSSYSNNFPKAIRTINKCVKNCCGFEDFLQTPSTSVTCKGLDLQALLLNPIQRLPRYLLLFKQLIKFTDVNHPDRVHVEQALVTLSNTITVLNNSIQSSLKVANGLRKRATRRPLSCHKDSITVCHRVSEQHVVSLSPDAKVRQDESTSSCATPPPSARPASICSSVSSGYASDEGESSPLNTCTNDEMTSLERNAEFTRLVQELRQQSALEQLAQQKFDFSESCISPTLQSLQILKLQDARETESDKNRCPVIPRRKCAVSSRGKETMDLTPKGKEVCALVDKEASIDIDLNNNITQQHNDLETGGNSTNACDNNQQTKGEQQLLSVPPLSIGPRLHRSYSDAVPISLQITDFACCDSQKDRGLATPEETPYSTRRSKPQTFQRFSKDRRSWAPGSTLSTQYSDNAFSRWGNRSSFRRSFSGDMFEEDSLSVVSDLSTMSGESSASGMSTVSVPVHGRHASKKRYHKLRDLFRSIRSKHRGSSYQNTMPTIPQNDVINIQRPLVIPRMMISTV